MEFDFNINNLLGQEVSRIDRNLMPSRSSRDKRDEYRKQLTQVIDRMGEASSKAQGLRAVITTGSKMSYSDHSLYILKDADANDGKGAVVGFLKMGHKKLFIYDGHGNQHESDPLCALDFYVHESRQRMGCGRTLFDSMLPSENVKPNHIAIDRPSHKFLSFLQKHYNLKATIPQVNNFVVFEGYFRDRPGGQGDKRRGKPPVHPYGRRDPWDQDPRQGRPPSGRAGSAQQARAGSRAQQLTQMEREPRARSAGDPGGVWRRSPQLTQRFNSLSLLSWDADPIQQGGIIASSYHGKHTLPGDHNDPSDDDEFSGCASDDKQEKETLSNVAVHRPGSTERVVTSTGDAARPPSASRAGGSDRGMGAQQNMYSRYNVSSSPTPKVPIPTAHLHQQQHTNTTRQDPSIMLRRDGPSKDYLQMLNTDLKYQGRGGHLTVGPLDNKLPSVPPVGASVLQRKNDIAMLPPAKPVQQDPLESRKNAGPSFNAPFATLPPSNPYGSKAIRFDDATGVNTPTFNVLGVPSYNTPGQGASNHRRFQQTKLW